MKSFEEVYETLPGNGWLTREEAELLWRVASATTGPILEVGSYYGRSTVLLAALGRPVYAIDPFDGFDSDLSGDEVQKRFFDNIQGRGIDNVTLFRRKIEDWARRPVGFAYLDGDHTFEGSRHQIQVARACGVHHLCIHDYADDGGGKLVADAVAKEGLRVIKRVERMAHCETPK